MFRSLLFSALTATLLTGGSAFAQDEDARSPFGVLWQYRLPSTIDGGGEVESQTVHGKVGVPLVRGDGRLVAVSAAYGVTDYSFSGGGEFRDFSNGAPWGSIHQARLGLPVKWDQGEWSIFAAPGVRFSGERGADFGDSLSYGGIFGSWKEFSPKLSLGPGFGVQTQIEDDPSFFPVIFIDWKLSDRISLTTGPSAGATLGPGLSLKYQICDHARFTIGARYEKRRFRLDNSSDAAPSGVGEDRTIPVFGALTFDAGDHWQMSVLGGVTFGSTLRLEDGSGKTLIERDSDPAPFFGVNAAFKF